MPRAKPTVYLDTNILSVLHYDGPHIQSIAQRVRTREWWEMERKFFEIYSSGRTEKELSSGVYRFQSEAIAEARRLNYLTETGDVRRIIEALIGTTLFPVNALGDAVQLAFAISYRLDYLLTWNYAHFVNVDVQRRLNEICGRMKWRVPLLVSPETIPWRTMGREMRREDA